MGHPLVQGFLLELGAEVSCHRVLELPLEDTPFLHRERPLWFLWSSHAPSFLSWKRCVSSARTRHCSRLRLASQPLSRRWLARLTVSVRHGVLVRGSLDLLGRDSCWQGRRCCVRQWARRANQEGGCTPRRLLSPTGRQFCRQRRCSSPSLSPPFQTAPPHALRAQYPPAGPASSFTACTHASVPIGRTWRLGQCWRG